MVEFNSTEQLEKCTKPVCKPLLDYYKNLEQSGDFKLSEEEAKVVILESEEELNHKIKGSNWEISDFDSMMLCTEYIKRMKVENKEYLVLLVILNNSFSLEVILDFDISEELLNKIVSKYGKITDET